MHEKKERKKKRKRKRKKNKDVKNKKENKKKKKREKLKKHKLEKKKRKSLSVNSDFTKSPRGPGASPFFNIHRSFEIAIMFTPEIEKIFTLA